MGIDLLQPFILWRIVPSTQRTVTRGAVAVDGYKPVTDMINSLDRERWWSYLPRYSGCGVLGVERL